MIISWCNSGGETTLELPGDNIRVYDMYGNLVSEGNIVPQNEEPYYIYGVDESIFKTGMSDRIVNDYNSFTERYADSLSDSAKEKIAAMRDRAADIGSLDAAGVEALISDHYAEGIELMKECGNAMFEAENTNMYYI